jgi:hypothetical protein
MAEASFAEVLTLPASLFHKVGAMDLLTENSVRLLLIEKRAKIGALPSFIR